MIVPRTRLLFWVAVVVLPFALLAAVAPATISLLLIGVFFIVAIVDAVGGEQSLNGIGIELPAIVRMSKDREAKLELRIFKSSEAETEFARGAGLAPNQGIGRGG